MSAGEGAPRFVAVRHGELEPTDTIGRIEEQAVTWSAPSDLIDVEQVLSTRACHHRRAGTAATVTRHRQARALDLGRPRQLTERSERGAICDSSKHDGCREEREEAVSLAAPSCSGLRQILEASDGQEALPTTLTHQLWQIGERRNVGELVEGEEDRIVDVRPGVGGCLDLAEQPDDQWGDQGLLATRCADVERVSTFDECLRVDERTLRRFEGIKRSIRAEHARRC